MRPVRCAALVVSILVLLAGCDSSGGSSGGSSGDSSDDSSGGAGGSGSRTSSGDLTWGDGDYGVVMAHGAAFDAASWTDQAEPIAALGATVVAVEDTSTDSIGSAVQQLHDQGIADVALIGGSAGADSILDLLDEQPDLADQIILLSPNHTVDGLGDQPKLFVASEDEPVVDISRTLAEESPGDENVAEILPGSAHAQNIFDTDQADTVLDLMLDRMRTFGTEEQGAT